MEYQVLSYKDYPKLKGGEKLICIHPNEGLNLNGIYTFHSVFDGDLIRINEESDPFFAYRFALYKKQKLKLG